MKQRSGQSMWPRPGPGRTPGRTRLRFTSSAADEEKLQQLRRWIVGPEQTRLTRLEQRLDDSSDHVERVADVLPRAIHKRSEQDGQLAWSLKPTIRSAIREDVRTEPEVFAEAIFPAIGPGIRKAIRAALADMVQRLNEALTYALSLRSLRWRIEAAKTGVPYAEVVLLRTLLYRVEQVLLVHRESGLLLQHVASPGVDTEDPTLVSGMLTAIRAFTREAFREREGLDKFQAGPLAVYIAAGAQTYLAAVVRGTPASDIGVVLQTALQKVLVEAGPQIDHFAGDVRPFERTRPILEECLRTERQKPSRRRGQILAGGIAAAVLLGAGAGLVAAARAERRFDSAVQALRDEPGIVVEAARKADGRYDLSGLRDPLARTAAEVLAPLGVDAARLRAHFEPFQSLDPQILQRRVERLLSPPAGVTLAFAPDRVTASGHAPRAWIQGARQRMAALESVVVFSSDRVVDDDARAEALARAVADVRALAAQVEKATLRFPTNSADPLPGQGGALSALKATIERLVALAPRAALEPRIWVLGHADAIGSHEVNERLVERRAAAVRSLLVRSGVPESSLVARGVRGPDRRRVTFRVELLTTARRQGQGQRQEQEDLR